MKKGISLVFAVFAFIIVLSAVESVDPKLQKGWQTIRPEDSYNCCKKLASKEFAGRFTGHSGYTAAAKWAASRFKEWGLKPIDKKEGYLQPYPSPYSVIDEAEMMVTLLEEVRIPVAAGAPPKIEMKETKLKPSIPNDFMPLLFSDSGQASGEMVFVGWGISAPDINYDDYAGVDVKGKFVLCFRGTPDGDKKYQYHDEHRTRMKVAQEKGALGLIYIYAEVIAHPNGDLRQGFMPAMISENIADKILKEKNTTSLELKKALQTYKRPISFPLSARIDLKVKARHFADGIGYNIAGYVEGSDPKLKNECIIIGGHFDGVGEHLGILFPGADDNASGSAVVMETAEAFAKNGVEPKRSVMFALFGGEEHGLKGSTYFADHIPQQFNKVDAMFNFDMEGVGDHVSVSFTENLAETRNLLEKADAIVKIISRIGITRSVGVRGSDFASFFLKGVPCASFGSNGPRIAHTYHLPGDSIFRINPEIMNEISKLTYLYGFYLADR